MNNTTIDGTILKQMILNAASRLEANKETVNALNVFPVPDGDTGTNMSMTMASAVREVEKASDRTVSAVAAALAQGSLMGARGNSGVILSQLFRGFAKACDGKSTLDGPAFAMAMQDGVQTAYKAVMKPVEGTILTVARESAEAAMYAARRARDPGIVLRAAVAAAEASLERTPDLLPVLKKAGVVDSGGKGLTLILQGYCEVLTGDAAEPAAMGPDLQMPASNESPLAHLRAEKHDLSPARRIDFLVDDEISAIQYPYDCELFIRRQEGGRPIPMEAVAKAMEPMGDSIYVVGSEDLAKVHIHSSNPGPVLSLCIQYGELIDIVIHNMREQHADLLEQADRPEAPNVSMRAPASPAEPEQPAETPPESAQSSVVAVSVGEGIAEIFLSLGVSRVIQGGQSMNPSTQDLLEAIEAAPGEQIFVLPNNKNIILAAEQAALLTAKSVWVIPSRSIPQGIAALLSWMPQGEGERMQAAMIRSMESVQTGEVTFSVRDTVLGELTIKEGDILGLWNGQIKLTGPSPETVATALLAEMVAQCGGEVITLYWGEGVQESVAEALGSEISQQFPDHEVEVQYGGQPLYFYLLSLE